MLGGFYTALSGVLVQQRTLDVYANNITNINTPGYNAERVVVTSFADTLYRQENGQRVAIGTDSPVQIVDNVITNTIESSLKESGSPTDFGLVGAGYFNVRGDDGTNYLTRNGNFYIDEGGYLAMKDIGRVQGNSGDLFVGDDGFTVLDDGSITGIVAFNALEEEGVEGEELEPVITTFKLSNIPDDEELVLAENGLFVLPNTATDVSGELNVVQGWLETSNYDMNKEMALIMETQRSFQASSSILQMLDTINQKTATQIGNIV